MSRRKQSNPKPLKSDVHEKLPLDFRSESDIRKGGGGGDEEWATDADSADKPAATPTSAAPVVVERTTTIKTEQQAGDDYDKKVTVAVSTATDSPPRIRLKANLATDPALQTNKTEPERISPNEYLTSLPVALQTLASRGYLLPNLTVAAAETPPERQPSVPLFVCPPCGIRFSSLSTLEAHQTFYCSHRLNKSNESDDNNKTAGGGAETAGSQSDPDHPENAAKAARTGKQYTCTHCSYSADKKVSLNRHMRMHTVSPGPAAASSGIVANGENIPDCPDRYCAECDIRFSSQKTYRAHKMHYCSSRHVAKAAGANPVTSTNSKTTSSCTSGSTPTSPVDVSTCRTPPSPGAALPPQQPFLALPTNPIIIVPYSLFRSASLLSGLLPSGSGLPNPDTPCFLLPNGTLQPMTQALAASATASQQTEVLKTSNHKTNKDTHGVIVKDSSAPLDLTVRKSPEPKDLVIDLGDEHEKENHKRRSPSPEKIECAPSLRGSPTSPALSISPKRKHDEISRSNSPRMSSRLTPKSNSDLDRAQISPDNNSLGAAAAPFGIPASLHPLLLRNPLLPPELQLRLATGELPPTIPPPVTPQVLVKQGVSKCKECNIVFCKHENYLIHKKHYCSARTQEDEASKTSGSPPNSPGSGAGTTSPAGQYQQLICLACGIKFTSLDNLNAHQAYYCLKRGDMEVRRCGKCRAVAEPNHQCAAGAGSGGSTVAGWKCPCCDVISATASAAQRHMESHTGVKAYRCTICRYKGNTLRGMRTHIRMHFDKRSPDLQEEKYISYILEDDGSNVMEVNVASSAASVSSVNDDPAVSPNSEGHAIEPIHRCNHCSYSSVYKANVLRHTKLVHDVLSSPSDDSSSLVNGNNEKLTKSMPSLEEEEEIVIKKEAIEPEVIIASMDDPIKEELPDVDVKPKLNLEREDDFLQEAAKPGPKYCKSCDITFTYCSTFLAHKKFYCSSHAGEITAASANNNNQTNRPAETSVL